MTLAEKHIISPTHEFYHEIDSTCFLSKNLYNKGNYIIRQEFISTSKELEKEKLKEEKAGKKVPRKVKRGKKKVTRKSKDKKKHATWIRYNQLQKMLQDAKDPDYYALPAKISQQVLMQLDKNWKSFFSVYKTMEKKFIWIYWKTITSKIQTQNRWQKCFNIYHTGYFKN